MACRELFLFGTFTLDVTNHRLSGAGEAVRLSPKASDVLVALVREPGRLVTKHELLARVWPESFVEEGILTVHVSALRKALGDNVRPAAYIETVARSGYRFIASVPRDSAADGPSPLSAGRGRSHLLSGSHFELPNAVDAFRAAIEIAPTYGNLRNSFGTRPRSRRYPVGAVECDSARDFTANRLRACSAGTDKSLTRGGVGMCPRWCGCPSVWVSWLAARARGQPGRGHTRHERGDGARVK